MPKYALACGALLLILSSASAWNDKGHMVVARLAWNKLSPDERTAIVKVLEKHPHYNDFLKAKRPETYSHDEWVFLRAATWSDWVRSGSGKSYTIPKAHYINISFVQPGSTVTPPGDDPVNIVQSINDFTKKASNGGSREDVAVATTWVFHLVGDIHQPLHCFTLYNSDFPTGDRGGNRALARLRPDERRIQMHSFWDGLLGKSTSRSSILGTVDEVEKLAKDNPALAKDLTDHTTTQSWAQESHVLAKKVAYLDGKLKPANNDDDLNGAAIPLLPNDYAEVAGDTARYCVAKAGQRLATVLKVIAKKNPVPPGS